MPLNYPSNLSIIPGNGQGVTQHHGMCMMSPQTVPDNRPTHVRYTALYNRGRVPLQNSHSLVHCPCVYRWMCCAQACTGLQRLPYAFRVSSRPSSQAVDCSRPSIPPSALHATISFPNGSKKQLTVPCDIIYSGRAFGQFLGDQLCWECRNCGRSSENICMQKILTSKTLKILKTKM